MEDNENVLKFWIVGAFLVGLVIVLLFGFFGILVPMMSPWWAEMSGKSELAKAEQNRQIAVLEAQAKLDSAVKLADSEIARARGVAEANKIISESIDEQYLKYLYIQGIEDNDNKIIYIPTNGLLPVLEIER